MTDLHDLLDVDYDPDRLKALLDGGADVNGASSAGEAPLHVATRRRRLDAVRMLVQRGADIDARDAHGKTAWVHAARRGFFEISEWLGSRGADVTTTDADRLAIALSRLDLESARRILESAPTAARTGNPQEDRLLADMGGRLQTEPLKLLLDAGADLDARALDGGTALHQAAWFGSPENARLLIEAGPTWTDSTTST